MTKERAMELLNNIINKMSVAEKNSTVIEYLLTVGFTCEELVRDFGYYEDEVEDVLKSMEDENDD